MARAVLHLGRDGIAEIPSGIVDITNAEGLLNEWYEALGYTAEPSCVNLWKCKHSFTAIQSTQRGNTLFITLCIVSTGREKS